MSTKRTYDVIIHPKGSTPTNPSDVKEFSFETDNTDPSTLEGEANKQVVQKNIIDPASFRDHWEIVSVVEQTPLLAVKRALHEITRAEAEKLKQNEPDQYIPIELTTQSIDSNKMVSHTILLSPQLKEILEKWMQGVKHSYETIPNFDPEVIPDAMIKTAVEMNPSLHETLQTDPVRSHNELIATAIRHEDEFEKNLRSLIP